MRQNRGKERKHNSGSSSLSSPDRIFSQFFADFRDQYLVESVVAITNSLEIPLG